MKKFTFLFALFVAMAMTVTAQKTLDLTFTKTSPTAATVNVAGNGVGVNGITASIAANYDWKSLSANSTTFPNANILCPDKNTKEMTANNEGVFTITLNNVPANYSFGNITFTSCALNGSGAFQSDAANAQLVNFTLKHGDVTLGTADDVTIKVNSNSGEKVEVPFTVEENYSAVDGTLILTLTLSTEGEAARGCFYGLTKISIETEDRTEANVEGVNLAFNRTGTTTSTVSVAARNQDDEAFGAQATLVSNSHDFMGNGDNITSAILCPNVNGNTSPTIDLVFSLSGLPAGFTFNNIGLDIHALNSSGIYQSNGDLKQRKWNVAIKQGATENALASFGELNAIDIAAGVGTTGNVHKVWEVAGEKATVDENGNLIIKVTISANAATNEGCFFGLSSITLSNVKRSHDITFTDANVLWATMYYDYAVTVPEGVTAYYLHYTGAINNDYVTLTEITDKIVPANEAVILQAVAAATYTFEEAEEKENIKGNVLAGTLEDENITPDDDNSTYYILSVVNGEVGLYPSEFQEDGTFFNNAHKAYFVRDNSASYSAGLRFEFGTTGIENVESAVENAVYYDLSGRRVENPVKGIYIVNGKKVLVK